MIGTGLQNFVEGLDVSEWRGKM